MHGSRRRRASGVGGGLEGRGTGWEAERAPNNPATHTTRPRSSPSQKTYDRRKNLSTVDCARALPDRKRYAGSARGVPAVASQRDPWPATPVRLRSTTPRRCQRTGGHPGPIPDVWGPASVSCHYCHGCRRLPLIGRTPPQHRSLGWPTGRGPPTGSFLYRVTTQRIRAAH